MTTKNKFIHCRLSEDDFERFHANAEMLDLAPSEYIRYLIRVPVDTCERVSEYSVVVFDKDTAGKIHSELVRQGYHYNQAVHALNTVAFYVKRGGDNVEYFSEQFDKANERLADVRKRQDGISECIGRIERSIAIRG